MSTVFNLLAVITLTVNANPVVHNQLVETLHVMSTAPGDNRRPAMMTITTTTTTRPSKTETEGTGCKCSTYFKKTERKK